MELDLTQFEEAFRILQRERETLSLSRSQRMLYWALNALVATCTVSIVAFVALSQVQALRAERWILSVLLQLAIYSGALVLALFVLNLPTLRKTWRHIRLIRRMGISEVATMRLAIRARGSRFIATFRDLGLAAALLVMLVVAIGFRTPIVTAVALLLSGTFIFTHALSRARGRLEALNEVERLEQALSHGQPQIGAVGDVVEVPTETIDEIARIERAQIIEQRAQAIASEGGQRGDDYTVLKSAAVVSASGELPLEARLRVEEAIDEIALAAAAQRDKSSTDVTTASIELPDSSVRIDYSIDEAERKVRVHELRPEETKTSESDS